MKLVIVTMILLFLMLPANAQNETSKSTYVSTGLFIASIEEGGRIFTPVRMLPFDHPEALNHDFPTVLQLHKGEEDALLILGEHVGFRLAPTLQRYPTYPDTLWPYTQFDPPPVASIEAASVTEVPDSLAPLPGLRGVTYVAREPVSFIVDTRGLTLEERGMTRVTTMGLDIRRPQFISALDSAATFVPEDAAAIVVFK